MSNITFANNIAPTTVKERGERRKEGRGEEVREGRD
jgi:hypothetical protein